MEDQRFIQLQDSITEIRDTQKKVAEAILGNYDGRKGLSEQTRLLRDDVDELQVSSKLSLTEIQELKEFKKEVKKVVASLALIIPLLFELFKFGIMGLLEFFKHK